MTRRRIRMAAAVAVLIGICAGAAFAANQQVYLFGTVSAGKDASIAVWRLLESKATIFTSYEIRQGFMGHKKFRAMIIGTSPANVGLFIDTGLFKALPDDVRIRMSWSRVSDINGWGTEVNGEIHRQVNYQFEIKKEEIAESLALVKRLVKDNWLTELQQITQEKFDWLMAGAGVVLFERGFVIDFHLWIEGFSMANGGKWFPLFEFSDRSGYYR